MAKTTTVRITARGKRELARLAERWSKLRGTKATHQEVLENGLDFLARHEEEFLGAPAWRPMTDDEIVELEALPAKLGGWSGSWHDIDADVYP